MKISVVYYEELNSKKESAEVIEDVITYYDNSDDMTRLEWGQKLRGELENLHKTKRAEIHFVETGDGKRKLITSQILAVEPDLLVTYNLAGFELCTLTDGLSYNLLSCRQLHFIEKDNCPNEKYLQKDKSINMFLTVKKQA